MENKMILENNEEYLVINSTVHENIKYLLLCNVSNRKDICIRKVLKEDNKEYICRLENEELQLIINLFMKENKDLFE